MVRRRPDDTASADGRAAAPAVGVVAVAVLTIVVASILGSFVLDVAPGSDAVVPESTFEYAFSDGGDGYGNANDRVIITYVEGHELDARSIRILIDGDEVEGVLGNWSTEIGIGESITITDDGTDTAHASVSAIESGDGIIILWEGEGVDEPAVISTVEVP